jgi:hypothetical protein
VLHATAGFHHPAHAVEWRDSEIEAQLDMVVSLPLWGLEVTAGRGRAAEVVVTGQTFAIVRRLTSVQR